MEWNRLPRNIHWQQLIIINIFHILFYEIDVIGTFIKTNILGICTCNTLAHIWKILKLWFRVLKEKKLTSCDFRSFHKFHKSRGAKLDFNVCIISHSNEWNITIYKPYSG